jgi:hypothetical protein
MDITKRPDNPAGFLACSVKKVEKFTANTIYHYLIKFIEWISFYFIAILKAIVGG